MDSDDSPPPTDESSPNRTFLISTIEDCNTDLATCPYATTIEAWSQTMMQFVLIAVTCKRWGCSYCGRRKVSQIAHQVSKGRANRFLTLTTWTKAFETPAQAYEQTRRQVPKLFQRIRRKYGPAEYFRVLEVTKAGWPHYHFVLRSNYLPHAQLSAWWAELAQSKIVDIRPIKKRANIYFYVVKYLAKAKYIPWTNRRCSFSRGYLPADDKKQTGSWELIIDQFDDAHPSVYVMRNYEGCKLTQIASDAWTVDRPPEDPPDCDPAAPNPARDALFQHQRELTEKSLRGSPVTDAEDDS